MIIEDIKIITECESMDALEIVESVREFKEKYQEAEKYYIRAELAFRKQR